MPWLLCRIAKNLKKYFQMVHLIDRSGISSHFLHFLLHHKTFKIKIKVVAFRALDLYILWKMAKNDHVHEGGKIGRSNANLTRHFSVASFIWSPYHSNLVMLSLLILKCHILHNARWQIYILLLFCPFASEVLGLLLHNNLTTCNRKSAKYICCITFETRSWHKHFYN